MNNRLSQTCPGREAWTPPQHAIICNIGDLLMSWSDDRFKSTLHRVKASSEPDDYYGERYSIAFFDQPCRDTQIQGPLKKYPMVTGEEFTRNRSFRTLEIKKLERDTVQMEQAKSICEQEGVPGASFEREKVVAEVGA